MDAPFEYVFPAIRGIQAGREYYTSMCPLRLLPKIFLFDEEELVPELRAQRTLNRGRIPEMSRYIVENRNDYVFSAITASVDGDVRFQPLADSSEASRVGLLHIPMSARFIINDGQHRRAAIEVALRENPELADESIAVVFFIDIGLERCQQMFADLNRYAIRPSKSLGVLYDNRDRRAQLAKFLALKSPVFEGVVEMERSNLSARARKLFTLSAIFSATNELLSGLDTESLEGDAGRAMDFWAEVDRHIPEWGQVRKRTMSAADVRRDFIHSHGIALQALGRVGNSLLRNEKTSLKRTLRNLRKIDWSRSNDRVWEGRALAAGRVSKTGQHLTLTTNLIKRELSLDLTPEEARVEAAFRRGDQLA
jgi:DNA sulfur modification protein DndB